MIAQQDSHKIEARPFAKQEYTQAELITCVASRLLEDNRSVLVGTGLPMIASMLAQRSHAPNLLLVFEAGGIGPRIPELPVSVGDSRTFYKAVAATSMHDVMSACQAGYIDYGFLGAAALDAYGNINTTVIGDWEHPKVRLPGSAAVGPALDLVRGAGGPVESLVPVPPSLEERFLAHLGGAPTLE
jgi:acyl CoA:acetate/3-ketoacid CoA transferase beta subunit